MVKRMSVNEYEVSIACEVSQDLALRDVADDFFDNLENRKEERIIVDFLGVKTISRSFAHEYQVRKRSSAKSILEMNVPENVSKMFLSAMDYHKELRFPGLANKPFTQL